MINRSIVQEGNILRLVLAYASQGSETADSWVRFCQKATDEAEAAVRGNPPLSYDRDSINAWH